MMPGKAFLTVSTSGMTAAGSSARSQDPSGAAKGDTTARENAADRKRERADMAAPPCASEKLHCRSARAASFRPRCLHRGVAGQPNRATYVPTHERPRRLCDTEVFRKVKGGGSF